MNDSDRRIAEFEQAHPRPGGAKDGAVIVQLGMRPARYQQQLNRILSSREALEDYPMLVHRWERQTSRREELRMARVFG